MFTNVATPSDESLDEACNHDIRYWDIDSALRTLALVPAAESHRDEAVLLALVREARTEAALTQTELASRLGRPQSFVSKIESGERKLEAVELVAICRALGIPLVEFAARFQDRDA